jgi:hypothetical protein
LQLNLGQAKHFSTVSKFSTSGATELDANPELEAKTKNGLLIDKNMFFF